MSMDIQCNRLSTTLDCKFSSLCFVYLTGMDGLLYVDG